MHSSDSADRRGASLPGDRLHIEISGLCLTLAADSSGVLTELARRHACVRRPETTGNVIKLETVEGRADYSKLQALVETWGVQFTGGGVDARLEFVSGAGYVRAPEPALTDVTCSLLATATAAWLPQHEGLLLHASGVARGGRGFVFAGPSGAGKTTIVRLSGDAVAINDDTAGLKRSSGVWWLHPTPQWTGEITAPDPLPPQPVAGIFWPKHAPRHALRRLPSAEAAARLMTLPNGHVDEGIVAACVAQATAIGLEVPCYELEFRRDPGFWDLVASECR